MLGLRRVSYSRVCVKYAPRARAWHIRKNGTRGFLPHPAGRDFIQVLRMNFAHGDPIIPLAVRAVFRPRAWQCSSRRP